MLKNKVWEVDNNQQISGYLASNLLIPLMPNCSWKTQLSLTQQSIEEHELKLQ